MTVRAFDHVGILVDSFDGIRRVLDGGLGITVGEVETEPVLGLEILWVMVGTTRLELIRPLVDDSPAADLIRSGRGGVHHVAFEVDDVDRALGCLQEMGIQTRDRVSRLGAHGSRIGFVDPDEADAALIELVQGSR